MGKYGEVKHTVFLFPKLHGCWLASGLPFYLLLVHEDQTLEKLQAGRGRVALGARALDPWLPHLAAASLQQFPLQLQQITTHLVA